jgi:transcriptional regulator MftR-like protein
MEAVTAALDAVARASDERSGFADFARQRHDLIQTYGELRERELTKLASLGSALAGALRRRGVAEPAASFTAEVGIAVFKIAFERWVGDPKRRRWGHHMREVMGTLEAVAGGRGAAGARAAHAKPAPTPTGRRREGRRQ